MKKNLYLLIVTFLLILTSCEKEDISNITDNNTFPVITEIDRQISHFFDIATYDNVTHSVTGEKVRLEPRRHRGEVKIYLDSSVTPQEKQVIDNQINLVLTYIEGSGVSFVYTNDIDNFDIGIVSGSPEYMNSVFGTNSNPPDYWFGGVVGWSTCRTIQKRYMWFDPEHSKEKTIRHELMHTIGLKHVESGNSLMYHNLGQADDILSPNDVVALKLLYYDGVYGAISPVEIDNCSDDERYMYPNEEEELKEKIRLIIENDFN